MKLADEAGLRACLGRRASFSRGILPLLRARAVHLTACARAHQTHPGPVTASSSAVPEFNHPDQDRRAHRDAGPAVRRTPRRRHRPLGHLDRARRLRRQSRHDQEELGRVRALPAENVDAGDLLLPGRILVDARTHHPAQALPEAASADVGRRHQPRHGDRRRRARAGQSRPLLRGLRRAGEEDQGVSAAHQDVRAGRRFRQRTGRHDQLPVLPRRREIRRRRWARSWATPSTIWRRS